MNKQYLIKLDTESQFAYVEKSIPPTLKNMPGYSTERLEKLVPILLERIHVGVDIEEASETGEYDFAFSTPNYETELLKWKNDPDVALVKPRLIQVISILNDANWESPETLKSALMPYAEEIGKGEVFWPLRVALSGKAQSPDPFTIAYIIGKEETLLRIKLACDKING
ncbi:MAG: hypothetical protein R3B53_04190 [Candidatus Paceibacterota bacterium]